MRICFLSKMFPPVVGGSGVYAYEITNALAEQGHTVDVFTQSKDTNASSLEIHNNVSIYRLAQSRRYLVTFETLYYSVKARLGIDFDDYDVIHGTLMPASTVALTDRLNFDTPIVLTSHSFALSEVFAHSPEKPADYLLKYVFHPMNMIMDNVAARSADAIITISEQMEVQLSERYRLHPERITTISHGVDTSRYRPYDDGHPAVSEDHLTLLFVGRLISRKGVDLAIRSLAATGRQDIQLLIAGTGRLENQLKRLSSNLNVSDRVQFLGYVPDEKLPLLYASADVTLFTSVYEGFGLVLLESLSSGTPVIGPPVGGVPDMIENDVTGYIVERDPDSFATKIEHVADHRETLRRMSTASRSVAEDQSWNQVAKSVGDVYDEVVGSHDY